MDTSPSTSVAPPRVGAQRGIVTQLGRFVLVGGLSAVVDYGIYQALLHLGLFASVAKAISFVCGTTTAYLLNKRFTFDVPKVGGTGRFTGFVLLYGSTFFVNVGVNSVMLRVIPRDLAWQTSICWVIAQACATTINFLVLRMVIFRAPSDER
ncbi:MAG TPA: GtrA family protein [Pseudonocardia sp.]|nr:GtrA family protein [Pseudonocardia sp.]